MFFPAVSTTITPTRQKLPFFILKLIFPTTIDGATWMRGGQESRRCSQKSVKQNFPFFYRNFVRTFFGGGGRLINVGPFI